MKKILLIGTVSCGKTTLSQYLSGMELVYKKTQALDVIGTAIDTPGNTWSTVPICVTSWSSPPTWTMSSS